MGRHANPHYTAVAITLHWLIAAAIVTLIVAGLWMTDAIHQPQTKAAAFKVYQLHKSLGLTVLVLSVLRLVWRLINPPPPLPEGMSGFERAAAHLTHGTFYVLMLAIPLAGWAMVSASPFGLPTMVFGLFEWPHIPMLAELADKTPVEAVFRASHKWMAYGLIALLVLHVAAALKHQFINRDGVLARMLPGFAMIVLLIALTGATPTFAAQGWAVVPGESKIAFSGEHSGNKFKGTFGSWDGRIAFDPTDLAGSKAIVTVGLGSAKTGDATYDKTLPTADWFDIARGPQATFETTAFRAKGGDAYEADGTLTIRGVGVPVVLAFTFKASGYSARIEGKALAKRLDFGIGKGSDGDGSWVSLEIPVEIVVVMTRAP